MIRFYTFDNEIGELEIKGPSSAISYWNKPEKSKITFRGKWTKTGDKYIKDENGIYTYCGRADDMMKVSGQYVSPFEVEAALQSHDSVLEAAVVSNKDKDDLIKPKAYIVLNNGYKADKSLELELTNYVKSKLTPFKYPSWYEFIKELPKKTTGKIQRFKLRKMINEIIDYFEFKGNKIEIKSIIDQSNKLTPIIFLHEGLGVFLYGNHGQRK